MSAHHPVHRGLRGHSVGDAYPFIVYAQGPIESYWWYVGYNGIRAAGPYRTALMAETVALELKKNLSKTRVRAFLQAAGRAAARYC